MDVEKYTKGFGGSGCEAFSTVTDAQQMWSQRLSSGTWGFLQPLDAGDEQLEASSGGSPGPVVTLM